MTSYIRDVEHLRAALVQRTKVDPVTSCHQWVGQLTDDGYGKVVVGATQRGKGGQPIRRFSHIIAYELAHGPVPNGLELDHLCRNRACCNPEHLEPVTRQENVKRGILPQLMAAKANAKTHCYKGHLLSGDNLFLQGRLKKFRGCRTCRAERQKNRYAINREQILARRKQRHSERVPA